MALKNMKYEIDEQTVKALLQYLASRPYSEVFQGIQTLQSLKPINKKEEIKEK